MANNSKKLSLERLLIASTEPVKILPVASNTIRWIIAENNDTNIIVFINTAIFWDLEKNRYPIEIPKIGLIKWKISLTKLNVE
ncbi:hypothetical protein [Flavobacterium qiangtangense]|uniref:hypothetical protein n=1 Tax=Flavobacterium qiangtangense TaxID=1442595 RepID=UPI0036D40475